jgi:hypothetical protein
MRVRMRPRPFRAPFTLPAFLTALGAALALASPAGFAARPFNTDDARIVDPDGWQIESFVKAQRGSKQTEFWFLPGRNFGGALDRFEFTLGGNVIDVDPGGTSNLVLAQVKTLLRPLTTNGLGLALTVGVGRLKPNTPIELVSTPFGVTTVAGEASTKVRYNPYLNAIASASALDDAVVLHLNAGATRNTSDNQTIGNWGVGAELAFSERVIGIGETYGLSEGKPAYQFGVRFWAVPARWQVDGTYGWQHASPANLRWISLGVRILW